MDYLQWNDGIAAHFFNPKMAGRRQFLNITADTIRLIGKTEGLPLEDFVRAMKSGPTWSSRNSICDRAAEAQTNWRRRRLAFPPYIGFLALFVLAAGIGEEGEFASHAYYPRLRKLLGEEEGNGSFPGFHEMRSLWADLESWSQRDKQGDLGLFEYPATGRFVNVGLPISQAILTDQERNALHAIFSDGGLDAGIDVSDALLIRVLLQFGDGRLRPRTLRILGTESPNREYFEVLLAAVRDEILRWDGSVSRSSKVGNNRSFTHAALRICCEDVDLTASEVTLRLRCQVRQEFPEDGLTLSGDRHTIYTCEEYAGGWSTVLRERETGEPVDASDVDILKGISLRDTSHGWRSSLLQSGVRVLVSGTREGLPGYIELLQLPPNSPFLLIAHTSAWDLVERWGTHDCEGFQRLKVSVGLPAQCRLYSAKRAANDQTVRDVYPNLSLPTGDHLRLQGGIRLMGNTYFAFALPRVIVEASTANVQLYCNGSLVNPSTQGQFTLAGRSAKASKFVIQLKNGSEVLAVKSVIVASEFPWQGLQHIAWFDPLGISVKTSSLLRATAATVVGGVWPPFSEWLRPAGGTGVPELGGEIPEPQTEIGSAQIGAAEVLDLVREWTNGFSSTPPSFSNGHRLVSLTGGNLLSEGTTHYFFGFRNGSPGSYARAIQTFTRLLQDTADPIISSIARALLQLAFYRSNRKAKASSLEVPPMQDPFSRLEAEMRGLAVLCDGGSVMPSTRPDGIGFADISPISEDRDLEKRIAKMFESSGT